MCRVNTLRASGSLTRFFEVVCWALTAAASQRCCTLVSVFQDEPDREVAAEPANGERRRREDLSERGRLVLVSVTRSIVDLSMKRRTSNVSLSERVFHILTHTTC